MNAEEVLQLAVELSGLERVPEDSAVHVPGGPLRRVLFGLDVGPAELLLARELGLDGCVAHHPLPANLEAWRVYLRHVEFMVQAGVPGEAARQAVAERVEEMKVRAHAGNWDHTPSVARLLGMPLVNVHAPLDEIGRRRMVEAVEAVQRRRPHATVGEVAEALAALPEVASAATRVQIPLGDPTRPAGRVLVAHGALTNGGYAVARTCFEHGVDTVVYIHVDPNELARLRRDGRGNLVVVGHLAGDALGFGPFVRALQERGVEVVPFSGVPAFPLSPP